MRTHTPQLETLQRTLRKALRPEETHSSRRQFLRTAVGAAAALSTPSTQAAPSSSSLRVGIVGAGLAGLACADELRKVGIRATLYEASDRAGGRCFSMSGSSLFPGQVIERGGELIDNLHKTMLGYVKEFRLTLEDVGKQPGELFYYFPDISKDRIPEAKIVEEFRAFVPAMRADLRRLSPQPNALRYTPDDQWLDHMSLKQYLETRGAGPIAKRAIEQAYVAEYGRSADEQSCLNFLLFIHADRRSTFTPFGVFSDERYHVVEGNDAIPRGLAARLEPGQLLTGRTLTAAALAPDGKAVRLTFAGGKTVDHDVVVFAVPFSTLAMVDLKGLNLPKTKVDAIQTLGYGHNAKMMVGFTRPYWRDAGSNGTSYSNLVNHQLTWETNPTRANGSRAVLTDYSGGPRGKNLNVLPVQPTAELFLSDLERVYPGAGLHVRRDAAKNIAVHREHWPSNPLSRGSYTCYLPGQFTTVAGHEGSSAGNIFFAGEHTDSFYEWQGFMEGALRSGIATAKSIVGKGR
ncbi:MAG TPA: FAD-dependent oxidoreductase [Bryobacteraceae bacterium]|nr:FAD-dependent oxidoreductase [Bryobacteraceae bacterium]